MTQMSGKCSFLRLPVRFEPTPVQMLFACFFALQLLLHRLRQHGRVLVVVVPVAKDWGLGNRVAAVRVQGHATNLSPVHLGVWLGLHSQISYLSQAAGPCASSMCRIRPGSPSSPIKESPQNQVPGNFSQPREWSFVGLWPLPIRAATPFHGADCVFCSRFRANSRPPAPGTSTAA